MKKVLFTNPRSKRTRNTRLFQPRGKVVTAHLVEGGQVMCGHASMHDGIESGLTWEEIKRGRATYENNDVEVCGHCRNHLFG